MIQDCYQKLLAPGGLDSFRPPPDREVSDAFGAWLWAVVHHHCNNRAHYLQAQPAVGGDGLESVSESQDAITPEQEFARTRIRELSERAVAELAPSWRAKGPVWSERLDVILQLISEKEADSERARTRLGISDEHLRQLKFKLTKRIRHEWRKQILDDLIIEPGVSPEVIELMIDREIEDLFEAAYPGTSPLTSFDDDTETETETETTPKEDDEPESTP
jgi:hypothetical protein